jgi:hypothetical protein
MKVEIYDIETLHSGFCYIGLDIHTQEINKFIIHKDLDQSVELINHIKSLKGMIGFNNIGFDYPVLHEVLRLSDKGGFAYNANDWINVIYSKAQSIINEQNKGTFGFDKPYVKPLVEIIPQLDLFLIHHFNNLARTQSLKGLEIWMQYPNVQDMPIHHNKEDITLGEMQIVTDYCINDVKATYEFYKLSKGKIDLRRDLNNKYQLGCFNYSDSKIGEALVLKLYCDKTNQNIYDVRKLRTKRDSIAFKDCIFDYIKFKTPDFNKILEFFKAKIITETKNSFTKSLVNKEFKYVMGSGGIHGAYKVGIYESNENVTIKSLDVASLYPSLAILNNIYPEHLGKEFVEVYGSILKDRLKAKALGDMNISDALKLSLNSCYGKSNDKFSFLYDPLFTMKITISGQLSLLMLAEQLQLEGFKMLMINTDGLECIVPNDKIHIYNNICNNWQELTKLTLEFVDYSKMIIRDVNNYISLSTKGKVKRKGSFVIDKEYHQDPSFKIIPIALSEYFINSKPIEDTIKNHKNIYDFCGRAKFKSDSYGEIRYINRDNEGNSREQRDRQQKTTRYYISKKGATFIKVYPEKQKEEFINKGFQVTIFNRFIDKEDYNIDKSFYVKECLKEIEQIEDKQLNLF